MNAQAVSSTATHYAQTAGRLGQATLALYNGNLLPLEIFAVLISAVTHCGHGHPHHKDWLAFPSCQSRTRCYLKN